MVGLRHFGFNCAFLVVLIVVFQSCANHSVSNTPHPGIDGMKEIRKGAGWYQKGCYQQALDHFFRANEIFTVNDQLLGVANSLNNIGNVYRIMGDPASAVSFFDNAYEIYRQLDNCQGMIQSLSNQAATFIDMERLAQADKVLKKARQIEADCDEHIYSINIHTGILLTRQKQYSAAKNILRQALDEIPDDRFVELASANFAMANLMVEMDQPESALPFLKQALQADRQSGFHKGIADDLVFMGTVYAKMGNHQQAVDYFQRGIKIYAILGETDQVQSVLEQLKRSAGIAHRDISVTTFFLQRWLSGKLLESPCQ